MVLFHRVVHEALDGENAEGALIPSSCLYVSDGKGLGLEVSRPDFTSSGTPTGSVSPANSSPGVASFPSSKAPEPYFCRESFEGTCEITEKKHLRTSPGITAAICQAGILSGSVTYFI